MTTTKIDKAVEVGVLEPVEASLPAATPLEPIRMFRDKAYMSRLLIMPDGRGLDVRGGQVGAFGDDQFAFLNAHPDLERIVE